MLKALALLLLCGLLPICQGGAEKLRSVAQVDKAVLENVMSGILTKDGLLQRHLRSLLTGGLSRNLLGGLNGGQNGGLLGPLLGGQNGGLLNEVLGGQSGGLLNEVLGGQNGGLLGPLLGGQNGGLLNEVLGGQNGGLLNEVLGGQNGGLLNEVLGGQNGGLLGPLLGGQNGGLLNEVLGGQNGGLLGPLLGGQNGGLLNEVLGGQNGGLLGPLLGGQNGGPLNEVLGGQNGGLLGGPLGSEGLLRLKFVDIILPKVSLKLFPGVGIGLNINTKVVLKGNTLLGGALSLLVDVNITANARLVQDKTGTPKLLIVNCRTNLGGIQILSGILPPFLENVMMVLLNNLIPGVLCPVADVLLNILNTVLATVNNVCPFGMLGNLHYTLAGLPLFRGQHIILNLNLMITDLEGKTTAFPTAAQQPSLPLPPVVGHISRLLLPRELLSSLLQLLVRRGGFNAEITEQALHGSVPMTTSALQSVLPKLSQLAAEDLPLVVRIQVHDVPAVSLQNGTATILLDAALEVLAHTNSSLTSLFTVDMNISLSGIFTVTRTKLGISLALQSVSLGIPETDSFDEKALETWVTDILQIRYLSLINGNLNIGIPLPNIFNLNFIDGAVDTLEDMLVINKFLNSSKEGLSRQA